MNSNFMPVTFMPITFMPVTFMPILGAVVVARGAGLLRFLRG